MLIAFLLLVWYNMLSKFLSCSLWERHMSEKKSAESKTDKPQKRQKKPARVALYARMSEAKQEELFNRYGGEHPLGLLRSISMSLRLKQQPSYDAAFTAIAREHGVTHNDFGPLKSLIGAILNSHKKFKTSLPKKESFYDFKGCVIRLKEDNSTVYQVEDKWGERICFERGRDGNPHWRSSKGNPSPHLIRAAMMFAFDHWKKEEDLRPSDEELYAEHAQSVARYWAPGEAPTEEELNR